MEESVNHVELGMQHSTTKNPEKQKKKLIFFPFYFTYMYSSSLKVSFPIIVSLYIRTKTFWDMNNARIILLSV